MMVAPRARSRTPIASSSRRKTRYTILAIIAVTFYISFDQSWRNQESIQEKTSPAIDLADTDAVVVKNSLTILSPRSNYQADFEDGLFDLNERIKEANITTTVGYMQRHAKALQEESDRLEGSLEDDRQQATSTTTARISHPLHLVIYASPPTYESTNINTTDSSVMVELLRLQAERSGFFVSITVLGPSDVPPEFRLEFDDSLLPPMWGDQPYHVDYGLWRYPLWEIVMKQIPLYDTILFLDASNTAGIYATGRDMLDKWVNRVVEASERPHERRELMRFPQDPRKNGDLKWTNDAVFDAFGLEIQGDNSWWQATKVQYYGGLMLVRNGAQWRNMTSLIYKTLAKDPYIITDRYSEATKKRRPTRFAAHKYHQSISSIASKVLDHHIQSPLMAGWNNPPFRLCQHQVRNYAISQEQVQQWSMECKTAGRDKDQYCDSFFDGVAPSPK